MDQKLVNIVRENDIETLAKMLRSGELMSLNNEERAELPRMIAASGNQQMLSLLAERSHAIAWEPDHLGRDVLHYAAQSGNEQITAYAVEMLGMDPVRGDHRGITALDLARGTQAGKWLESYLGFAAEEGYRNPVRRGFYPDPSVVRVGEDYYMVNSTFVQFPCIPVSHSRDLVNWKTIGHAITNLEWSGIASLPGGHGYWAPDISYYKGRFWIIATLRRDTEPFRLQMVTSASAPEGPYDQPIFLDIDGIDPSIFTDVDGKRYVVINPGAQIAEIDETGRLISEPEMIYYGSSRVKTEGPHLLYKDGWYYLFQAEGGTGPGHTETVARSRKLKGPYSPCPYNPILGPTESNAPIRRSGHGKPFSAPDGRWFMLYLCGRDVDGVTMLGRETALDPLEWTPDGWPIVNRRKGPSCLQKKPLPESFAQNEAFDWLDFISPRTNPSSFAEKDREGWILQCGAMPSEIGETSLLLRRQSEKAFCQQVFVEASSLEENAFAGLCGYYDENSFYLFGIETCGTKRYLTVIERIGKEEKCVRLLEWNSKTAVLRIEADGCARKLFCQQGAEMKLLLTLDAVYLSDEGLKMGKRFTGATLGMAAVGKWKAVFSAYQETMFP